MRMVLRNILSKKRSAGLLNIESITRKEIESTMQLARKAILASMERIVADWSINVGFQARRIIKPDFIAINVFPTGSDKEIWDYVDKGTTSHTIRAKNTPYLKFRKNYQPRTSPKPARHALSGGGISSGPWTTKKVVLHPGSEGRNFEQALGLDYKPEFARITDNAFRRAARKINKR